MHASLRKGTWTCYELLQAMNCTLIYMYSGKKFAAKTDRKIAVIDIVLEWSEGRDLVTSLGKF